MSEKVSEEIVRRDVRLTYDPSNRNSPSRKPISAHIAKALGSQWDRHARVPSHVAAGLDFPEEPS
jgi:hypothetical protein